MQCGQPQIYGLPLALGYSAELAVMQKQATGTVKKGPLVSTLRQPRLPENT